MSLSDILQFLHVASAFVFVAGLIGRDVVLGRARRSSDLEQIRTLTAAAGPFERFMVIPGSFAVLVLGVFTWWAQGVPLWGQGTRWLPVSLILFASTVLLVPLVFVPRGKVFGAALTRASAVGRLTEDLRAALLDPAVAFARWYEIAVVVVVLWLMVIKPF